MAEEQRTLHEQYIYDIKSIFANFAKPKSSDFGVLIDMADNDPVYVTHYVNGTGDNEFHEDLNASMNFTTQYNEIHIFIHAVFGTYIFINFEIGSYGNSATLVTANDFIHLAPHPDLINDEAPSSHRTYSSEFIEENFIDDTEGDYRFVSRRQPTIIEKHSDINSDSNIYALNIAHDFTYIQDGVGDDAKGVLEYKTGPITEEIVHKLEINPFNDWKLVQLGSSNSTDVIQAFNTLPSIERTFKRGDLVVIEHDLRNVLQPDGTTIDYGKNLYLLIKDLEIIDTAVLLGQVEGELVDITGLSVQETKELFYTQDQVDLLIKGAKQGFTQVVPDLLDMVDDDGTGNPGPYSPANYEVGTQFLVNEFSYDQNETSGEPGALSGIVNIPIAGGGDPNAVQKQGVFVRNEAVKWEYAYQMFVAHTHPISEISDIQPWSQLLQNAVSLSGFKADTNSKHFSDADSSNIDTNTNNISTLSNYVGTDSSNGLGKLININAGNITVLTNEFANYVPIAGNVSLTNPIKSPNPPDPADDLHLINKGYADSRYIISTGGGTGISFVDGDYNSVINASNVIFNKDGQDYYTKLEYNKFTITDGSTHTTSLSRDFLEFSDSTHSVFYNMTGVWRNNTPIIHLGSGTSVSSGTNTLDVGGVIGCKGIESSGNVECTGLDTGTGAYKFVVVDSDGMPATPAADTIYFIKE